MSAALDRILERLEGVRQRSGGFMALCPAHDDQRPSLSVSEGDDGKVLLRCFADCSLDEILDALGLTKAALFERNGQDNTHRNGHRKPSAVWEIKDAAGEVQALHVRFDHDGDKRVLWRLPGARKWGLGGRKLSTLPLYRSEHVEDRPEDVPVVVVEGEKAADALANVYPAVLGTVTGAESTPGPEALSVLRGRSVVLWCDNDEPGRRHMESLAGALQGTASEVRVFEWKGAPEKGDAADHPVVKSRSREHLEELLDAMAAAPVWERVTSSSSSSSLEGNDDDDDNQRPGVMWFSKLGDPKPREFLVEDLIPARYPTVLFGGGGVAKSMLAMRLAIAVAGGADDWLGVPVHRHGTALYCDFELDADEQLRRARDLAAGMGAALPDNLGYLSALGMRPQEAFQCALEACKIHHVGLLILDSLGPAMLGDAEAAKDVIRFHNEHVAPFRAEGVTVLIVDHQGKVQAGESYQHKTSFGSAYKEHLARSVIQVEAGHRDRDAGTLTVRVRHRKTNFGVQRDPFDVRLTFGQGKIKSEPVALGGTDLATESTVNAEDRVMHALAGGPAFPDELAEITGLAVGTVKNCLTQLRRRDMVEYTGETKERSRQVRLSSSSSSSLYVSDDDDDEVRRRVDLALEAFDAPESGAARNLRLYLRGEAKADYLVNSVLYYHGQPWDQCEAWRGPIMEAVEARRVEGVEAVS